MSACHLNFMRRSGRSTISLSMRHSPHHGFRDTLKLATMGPVCLKVATTSAASGSPAAMPQGTPLHITSGLA
jgi:hypothetical protein